MDDSTRALSAEAAADHLAKQLGGKPTLWRVWLRNDRARKGLVPPLDGPGRPKYLALTLDAFVNTERAKRRREHEPSGRAAEVFEAFGIGQKGGSRAGRRLDCQVVGQLDEAAGQGFVQIIVNSPLLVFRLSPSEARTLAASLAIEANDAEHMAGILHAAKQA